MTIKTIAAIAAFLLIATGSAEAKCWHWRNKQIDGWTCRGGSVHHRHHHRSIKTVTHKKIYLSPLVRAKISEQPLSGLGAQAKRFLGMHSWELGLRRTLWCSAFLRKVTKTNNVDDRAISWLKKDHTSPAINRIAVMAHHVGIVLGFKGDRVILISGNHSNRVGIGAYPRQRIIAYVKV